MKIEHFDGPYRFLSNFWLCSVKVDGLTYPSAEHAYQALKSERRTDREFIRGTPSPQKAKALGRKLILRKGWEGMKLQVMEQTISAKFQDKELAEKLKATGTAELIEGNWWGDTYWGTCYGVGQNHLGRILMKVREQL